MRVSPLGFIDATLNQIGNQIDVNVLSSFFIRIRILYLLLL